MCASPPPGVAPTWGQNGSRPSSRWPPSSKTPANRRIFGSPRPKRWLLSARTRRRPCPRFAKSRPAAAVAVGGPKSKALKRAIESAGSLPRAALQPLQRRKRRFDKVRGGDDDGDRGTNESATQNAFHEGEDRVGSLPYHLA